jgi:hypothetical protein
MMNNTFNNSVASYAVRYGLEPADRIIEPIFQTGISKHHSIYLGMDEFGTEWIAENQKFAGVRLVKASDFFQMHKQYNVQKFPGNYPARIAAVKRALSALGQPYDLILYNCEHYASFVQHGKSESRQVQNGFAFACGVLLLAFAIR